MVDTVSALDDVVVDRHDARQHEAEGLGTGLQWTSDSHSLNGGFKRDEEKASLWMNLDIWSSRSSSTTEQSTARV